MEKIKRMSGGCEETGRELYGKQKKFTVTFIWRYNKTYKKNTI